LAGDLFPVLDRRVAADNAGGWGAGGVSSE